MASFSSLVHSACTGFCVTVQRSAWTLDGWLGYKVPLPSKIFFWRCVSRTPTYNFRHRYPTVPSTHVNGRFVKEIIRSCRTGAVEKCRARARSLGSPRTLHHLISFNKIRFAFRIRSIYCIGSFLRAYAWELPHSSTTRNYRYLILRNATEP